MARPSSKMQESPVPHSCGLHGVGSRGVPRPVTSRWSQRRGAGGRGQHSIGGRRSPAGSRKGRSRCRRLRPDDSRSRRRSAAPRRPPAHRLRRWCASGALRGAGRGPATSRRSRPATTPGCVARRGPAVRSRTRMVGSGRGRRAMDDEHRWAHARDPADGGGPGGPLPGARRHDPLAPRVRAANRPEPVRLHGARDPRPRGGGRVRHARGRGASGGRLGSAERGSVRARGPGRPLDRRRRPGIHGS